MTDKRYAMKEDDIKKFLSEGIAPVPSGNFNEIVLSRIPAKDKKKHFIPFDTLLVLLLFFVSATVLCLLFLIPTMQETTRNAILLSATGIAVMGMCIMFFNLIVSGRYKLVANKYNVYNSLT